MNTDAAQHENWGDILHDLQDTKLFPDKPPAKQPDPACEVYLITDGEYGKIGIAANVRQRLTDLQSGNPHQLWIVCTCICNTRPRARKVESDLHKRYFRNRRAGEWFKLNRALTPPTSCVKALKLAKSRPLYKGNRRVF